MSDSQCSWVAFPLPNLDVFQSRRRRTTALRSDVDEAVRRAVWATESGGLAAFSGFLTTSLVPGSVRGLQRVEPTHRACACACAEDISPHMTCPSSVHEGAFAVKIVQM